MNLLHTILISLVIVECIFIFIIETLLPKSKMTSRIFKIPEHELNNEYVNVLFKNQGIYNLILGLILLIGMIYHDIFMIKIVLISIFLISIYGSMTSQKKIIITQGGLPLLALITLIIN